MAPLVPARSLPLLLCTLGLMAGCTGEAAPGRTGEASGRAGTPGAAVVPTPPAGEWRADPQLTPADRGTEQLLQAVHVVDEQVVWVSGHGGTWGRSVDGGTNWEWGVVPGHAELEFRDVHAVHADTALLLAAGPGDRSRIFRTMDGGRDWTEVWRNEDPDAFFDCLDLWDPEGPGQPRRGIVFSDAVDGVFAVLGTGDGGRTWSPLPTAALPAALDGEGGFAASGTCVVAVGPRHAWIGTGAAATPRVLVTDNGGATWTASSPPLPGGGFAGITSLAFQDTLSGWAFGGNLGEPDGRTDNVARTRDGGRTWERSTPSHMPGAIYGGIVVPDTDPPVLVTVGPAGADVSLDAGTSWMALDTLPYWGLGFASASRGWLVGPGGRITRVDLQLETR